MPVTPRYRQLAIRSSGTILCTILLLAACTTNKVSPATLALQTELETRELKLQQEQEVLEEQNERLEKRAVKVKSQKKKNRKESRRLSKKERLLKQRLAAAKQVKPLALPVMKPSAAAETSVTDILLVGATEKLVIHPPNIKLTGTMDTGAKRCMLGVFDLTKFERDGEPHVRFFIVPKKGAEKIEVTRPIKDSTRFRELNSNGKKRPVVLLHVALGSIDEQEEFVLVEDNKAEVSAVSIGRNLLRDLAVVDVSKNMLIKTQAE